jgi:hypothetical protein
MTKFNIEKVCHSFAAQLNHTRLTFEKDIAQYIKKEVRYQDEPATDVFSRTNIPQFDTRKGATWHCIVGRNFGSFVTHGKLL